MLFKQYIPNFVTGTIPQEKEFNTLEELMQIDCLKRMSESPYFHRFSIQKDPTRAFLMVEYIDSYYVAGFIENLQSIDLPDWEG